MDVHSELKCCQPRGKIEIATRGTEYNIQNTILNYQEPGKSQVKRQKIRENSAKKTKVELSAKNFIADIMKML